MFDHSHNSYREIASPALVHEHQNECQNQKCVSHSPSLWFAVAFHFAYQLDKVSLLDTIIRKKCCLFIQDKVKFIGNLLSKARVFCFFLIHDVFS